MADALDRLVELGALDALSHRFARLLGRRAGADDQVQLAAALASLAPSLGHVCAPLDRAGHLLLEGLAEREDLPELPALPEVDAWREALDASPLCRDGGGEGTLLVAAEGSVYLDRFWRYERRLIEAIGRRVAAPLIEVDAGAMERQLERLFADGDPREAPARLAAQTAARRRLCVIHGGPGTGKTTVVVKILALLGALADEAGQAPLRVAMVAPTGKASARLSESVEANLVRLPEDLRERVAQLAAGSASTIHRRLGVEWRRPTFKANADNPLPVDVVVVDEASMVDLPLMSKLFDAVPERARLILLGDPDQLKSVELGSVLGDICRAGAQSPALGACLVRLEHRWRFQVGGAVDALADAIKAGEPEGVLSLLDDPERPSLRLVEPRETRGLGGLEEALRERVVAGFAPVLAAAHPLEALPALRAFRVLAAHRHGRWGVETLNPMIERWLADEGLIDPREPYYPGRPLMVTANDDRQGLYNGDVGLVMGKDGKRGAYFPPDDKPRGFRPAVLPAHATVFATTVHKSQGSEYDDVVVLLPDRATPIVTRELLYTAVTRAKRSLMVVGPREVVEAAIERRIERFSGLRGGLADGTGKKE